MLGEEYWARKGAVSLFLWRKREAAGRSKFPPVVLVHGSTLSSTPSFDLHVDGQPDYSFMEWLARRGHDVWTLDHEGYGRSTMTDGNSDIAEGVRDLVAATDEIARVTGSERMHIYGLSSGALRAASFAQARPDRTARLALDAFVWTGAGSRTLAQRKAGTAEFRKRNHRPIDRDFIASIFNRDAAGTTHPDVIKACAEAQLAFGDTAPTGAYLDMTTKLPLVDPKLIVAPTMIARGEHDGIAAIEDLLEFFRLLPTGDKSLAVLPGLAHFTPLGIRRHLLWKQVDNFFKGD